MAESLIERAWAWLHATFPERQIYIRSQGKVQFLTFGATLQATCAGLSLIFLGWVAFASVNVIFKDHIIAAKDHRFQQMQSVYENRVANLEVSYDELNNALVSAEDQFKSTADELEAKQRTVAMLLGKKQAVDANIANMGGRDFGVTRRGSSNNVASSEASESNGISSDSFGFDRASASPPDTTEFTAVPSMRPDTERPSTGGASQLNIMPQTVEPQPRTARPSTASFLDDSLSRLAAVLFRPKTQPTSVHLAAAPALRVIVQQTDRLKRLSGEETQLVLGVDRAISGRVGDMRVFLRRVGVNADVLEQEASGHGVGGPYVPIQAVRIEGIADSAFTAASAGATAHEAELASLVTALGHVPLTKPVQGGRFELTSGFGPRVDPFTQRVAFHTGIDFAGPWGSIVSATAPGIVVWAGPKGGYGNLVEVDHGYGFHTRYGHLASILVKAGVRVEKGSPLGKLGSTGRSTGPHVHYEVWLADVVKDPGKFIEVGQHVFE